LREGETEKERSRVREFERERERERERELGARRNAGWSREEIRRTRDPKT
jgi:hypothetical protein